MSFLDPDDAPIQDPVVSPEAGYRLFRSWDEWVQRSRHTYWEDLRFPAQGINPAGTSSPPTVVTSGTFKGTLLFSFSATNIIAGIAQVPHAWKTETSLEPHVHWCPTTAGAGNVAWRFSYQLAQINGTFPAAMTTAGIEVDAADGTANKHQYHEFTAIPMTGLRGVSTCIVWTLERVGGDASDTYGATARFLELDIHYELDLPGSRYEDRK